MHKNTKINC